MIQPPVAALVCWPAISSAIIMCAICLSVRGSPFLYDWFCNASRMSVGGYEGSVSRWARAQRGHTPRRTSS